LRSASLPERPIATAPPAPGTDRFVAAPDSYTPGRHRQPYFFPFVYGGGAYPSHEPRTRELTVHVTVLPTPPAPRLAEPIAPRPDFPPGPPKTFYVIPGCYAGDKPPADTPLASACDHAKLRIVPPGRGNP
jgi:hypothetical protein